MPPALHEHEDWRGNVGIDVDVLVTTHTGIGGKWSFSDLLGIYALLHCLSFVPYCVSLLYLHSTYTPLLVHLRSCAAPPLQYSHFLLCPLEGISSSRYCIGTSLPLLSLQCSAILKKILVGIGSPSPCSPYHAMPSQQEIRMARIATVSFTPSLLGFYTLVKETSASKDYSGGPHHPLCLLLLPKRMISSWQVFERQWSLSSLPLIAPLTKHFQPHLLTTKTNKSSTDKYHFLAKMHSNLKIKIHSYLFPSFGITSSLLIWMAY
jgi:hypothetical protein